MTDRLLVLNGGLLERRVRRILSLAGHPPAVGLPRTGDRVGVWGRSPTAWRGEALARRARLPLLRIEDAPLRSLHPGRTGARPMGLTIDRTGVHFDANGPSDLETLLATHPLSDPGLLGRADELIARLKYHHLTKYAAVLPDAPLPPPGYVLVVDQTFGDAAIGYAGAGPGTFARMLAAARAENPGARIVIKTHPETARGLRRGHFGDADAGPGIARLAAPASPWSVLAGAAAVYCVSSQMGFEAILAGHRPHVFGRPFYAGWGLSADRMTLPRRGRALSASQLAAAALILHPTWYDPHRDRLCEVERIVDLLAAQSRAWREDRHGYVASGMRLWKRGAIQRFFGHTVPVRFGTRATVRDSGRMRMCWASRAGSDEADVRVEDGFVRSRGLGAALTPPLSLVRDDLGIYYDPSRESRLERLIGQSADLPAWEIARAARLIETLVAQRLSKYNLASVVPPPLPGGPRILVPGQVEDDASIRLGAGAIRTNADLLAHVRRERPDAAILYKPHPDVEAGLRGGAIDAAAADVVLRGVDPAAILSDVDEVWTITSGLGFEALLRGVPVVTLGAPFYAGWGLTTDLGATPSRRSARPSLPQLAHAVLIGYARYHDPVADLPCPVEVAVDLLGRGTGPRPGLGNRLLSRLQGRLASHAHLWR